MIYNNIHITSLDILVETILNHQKLDIALPYLKKICADYDTFYARNDFTQILHERIDFYKELIFNDEETLFILNAHIPYLVKKEIVVLEDERFNVYVIILYWINKYHLPQPEIYFKLATGLNLNSDLSQLIEDFILEHDDIVNSKNYLSIKPNKENQLEKLEGDWIDSNKPDDLISEEILSSSEINQTLFALFLPDKKAFLLRCGNQTSTLQMNLKSYPDSLCILKLGDSLCLDNNTEVSFTDLKKKLVEKLYSKQLVLTVENLSLDFKNKRGIKPVNLSAYPGQLIGVLGKQGAGKSSLLKILAGIQAPTSGDVYVNAYKLFQNIYRLVGIIGYVPEDDLLFSELTVYENIEFVARLHLEKENRYERNNLIQQTLEELELTDISDTRVGEIEEKKIPPGKRRLLNIALELVRDPQILIIDNSKSGLSLSDASQVIELLSKYTFKGKIIITTITQTGKKSFDNFDNLLILNENGYAYYYGSRHGSLNYFTKILPEGIKKEYENLKSFTSIEILELIDRKDGGYYKDRLNSIFSEKQLYEKYWNSSVEGIIDVRKRNKLPRINTPPPRLEKQYITFTIRNFTVKWAKKKDLAFTILAAPVLAALLSILLKKGVGDSYTFSANDNIPTYFFLGIIINIFLGLSQSAREIIGEKYILQKEERINLSLFSYVNSKISFLFIILALQTWLYTITGNSILEINDMLLFHWLVYFSCGAAGVLLGLIFSSIHKLYESILLKTIPITIILLILLGGGWVPVDKLKSGNNKYSPIASDLMISRWAYEALMVQQFVNNPYERNFYITDKEISVGAYNTYQILPLLNNFIDYVDKNYIENPDSSAQLLTIIRKRFNIYYTTEDIFPFEFLEELKIDKYSSLIYEDSKEYLKYLDYHFYKKYSSGIDRKRAISDSLSGKYGSNYIKSLELKNSNHSIIQKVRNTNSRKHFILIGNDFVQLSEMVFQPPLNDFGRAQLFSSIKKFNNQYFSTFEFNLSIIWLINLFAYILLITNIPYKFSQISHKSLFNIK